MGGFTGHRCEFELGPLPLVLVPDLGGRNLVAAPRPVENGLDEGPLLLQGVAGGEMKLDLQMPYARGISRSS